MRVKNAVVTGARALALGVVCLAGSITLFVFCVVSMVLIAVGVGMVTTPWVLQLVRTYANWRRVLAAEWGDVKIPAAYRPLPRDLGRGPLGQIQKCFALLRDPSTWRDIRWLFVDMTAGAVTALVPGALVYYPVEGLLLGLGLWTVFVGDGGRYWYAFVPVDGEATALAATAVGAALAFGAVLTVPALLRAHFQLSRAVLAPSAAELERRVEELTRTRHDAVDTSAAELRRIERDLHDGAQARLVAMGMSLGTIEALIERNPAKAKELVARARSDSAEALGELRDLVRGIHPPVLAERGLGPAAHALALRMPVPVEVDIELDGRAEEAVESAAYFAISEMLTNAAKHAEAERMWLEIGYRDGMLKITVTDNGKGGANPDGTGIRGVERRIAAFDGILAVSSPHGGPTMVTMEIPCTLAHRTGSSH
ncbi:histidine kinase [Streptomyces sp. NPDC050560]|uniref:sensor histidine kinase n=1 Tax=Streptomyces sp. NPDC050560 TaxID=3365630 RepID=UPI0037B6890F